MATLHARKTERMSNSKIDSRIKSLAVSGALVLLICAVVLVYLGSLKAPFIFDDHYTITKNSSIATISGSLFPPEDNPVRDRPLFNLSLALNRSLGGLDPFGYHILNLLIHAGAACVMLGLVLQTLRSPTLSPSLRQHALPLALASALLWALHPIQTESVTYISQRSESLCGLFYLLTIYCFASSRDSNRPGIWRTLSVVCCALGLLTKAVMVTAPVMILVYDRLFSGKNTRQCLRYLPGYYGSLAACWLIQAGLVLTTSYRDLVTYGMLEYASGQPEIILHYLWLPASAR